MATVVVVGAGIGGLTAAITLRKGLAREYEVAVVEREMVQGFYPSLLWVLEGRRTPKNITRSLDAIRRRGITLVHDTVQDVDMARRLVKCEREQVPYDFLVLAPGADHAPERVPGLVDAPAHPMASGSARTSGPVFNLFSIEGILGLRGALETAQRGDILVVAPTGPHKCPPVPVETAMTEDRVFATEDVTDIPMPRGGSVPKSGAVAHLQSLVVAGNIAALVSGKTPRRRFSGLAMCVVEMGDLPPVTIVGNFLSQSGGFRVLPRLRAFTTVKQLVERNWLRERQ